MIKKMLLAHHLNHPMLIYSEAVTLQLTGPKIPIIFPGWSISWRKIVASKLFNKILLQSNTEKVLVCRLKLFGFCFPFTIYHYIYDGFKIMVFVGIWDADGKCSLIWVWNKHCSRSALSLSSIILKLQMYTMKLCTKLTSTNSTISHVEPCWHTILAGEQN